MHVLRTSALLTVLAVGATASAAELQFDGAYRARGRMFNSLSLLPADDVNSEGASTYFDHRVWLRPKVLVSDQVAAFIDIRALDGVTWGTRNIPSDPWTSDQLPIFEDELSAPASTTDASAPLSDITLWRAWGEVQTGVGRLSFGRQPLHWGSGIWLNDGLGLNAEYGDSADRVQFEALIQDQFYILAAVDVLTENFANRPDDETAFNVAFAYRNETVTGGLNMRYRRGLRPDSGNNLDLFTVDLAFAAELGRLEFETEWVAQFGGGDLSEDVNDTTIATVGGILDAELDLDKLRVGVNTGLATGDKTDDNRLRTHTFDRDYNVGLMMFERPLPVIAATVGTDANDNRDFDTVLTGNAVSNALYVKPRVGYKLVDGFTLEATLLAARAAAVPDSFGPRNSYGLEVGAGAMYTGIEHFELDARVGYFLPGSFYREFSDTTFTDGFTRPALGFQVTSRVRF